MLTCQEYRELTEVLKALSNMKHALSLKGQAEDETILEWLAEDLEDAMSQFSSLDRARYEILDSSEVESVYTLAEIL